MSLANLILMIDHQMSKRLMKADLNLLVVLNALQETGSTVGAADRIGRTQSAVSLALNRLRDMFSDPLFVRAGTGLEPTSLCLQLRAPVQHMLSEVVSMIDVGYGFDPDTSHRRAVFSFPDNALIQALEIKKAVEAAAPEVTLNLVGQDLATVDYERGLQSLLTGEIDLMLSFYRGSVPNGLELLPLPPQDWISLVSASHPISDRPDLEEWCHYGHVRVSSGQGGRNPVGDILASLSKERHIALQTSNFLQALIATMQSDYVLTTMSPIILPLANQLGLRQIKTPIDVPQVPLALLCRTQRFDPFGRWLTGIATSVLEDH